MRRTIYLSLAALGAATIATAAVMTSTHDGTQSRRAQASTEGVQTHQIRAIASESETPAPSKKGCRRECWFSFD